MPIFNIFSFEIKPSNDGNRLFGELLEEGDVKNPCVYDSPADCLGSFFTTGQSMQLPVLQSKGRSKETTCEMYKCDVMRHEEGVILMTIENNKVKHTTVDKKDKENPHHPYCNVIIDNRIDRQLVCIERNSAFDSKPEKVAHILMMGLSYLLKRYGREISLTHLKKKSTEFWPVVDDLRTIFKDKVKQVRLDFNGDEDDSNESQLLRLMTGMARKAQSEAAFMLNAEGDGEVKLNEVYEDLTNMADICLRQRNYSLTVKFNNFGVYRYGADLLAQFGVDDEVLGSFESGSKEFDFDSGGNNYALLIWLDKLSELLNGYKKYDIQKGRKNRRRR